MIFNNEISHRNLFGSSYLSGNIVFHNDSLYSPVGNMVKKMDLVNHTSYLLPLQLQHQIKHLVVNPNGTLLIAIDMFAKAVLFNLKGEFQIGQFNFKQDVVGATFSPDGKLFAVAQDKGFTVYESPPLFRTFEPFVLIKKYKNKHASPLTMLKFSPDSRFLVTCGSDHMIYVNNLFVIPNYLPISLEVHRYKIIAVDFSPDMNYFYSIDSGSNIYVWKWVDELTEAYQNLKAAKIRKLTNMGSKREFTKVKDEKPEQNNDFSDFERKVNDGRFILATKSAITQPNAYLKRVFYQPANGFFVAAYSNGKFSIYKLIGEELTTVQTFSAGDHKISSITVNQSCTWVAIAVKALGQLIVWEWKSQSYILNQTGFIHETFAVAFNSAKIVATGTHEGKVKLWDKKTGFCVAILQEHSSKVTDLRFSNSNTLFSAGLDGCVYGYDVVKYRKFRKFEPDSPCQFNSVALDNSGDIVFAGSFDPYEVFSWSVQTGHILQIVKGHQGPISCLKMAGQQLITGSWDRTLKIHDVFARKLNNQTLSHGSEITALAVDPSGKKVAAATMKGEIYIWELQNSQLLGIIDAELTAGRSYSSKMSADNDKNSRFLKCIQFSACGGYLIGGGRSKYLMIYDIRHRSVLTKMALTQNLDIQGVVEKLNSKYVKNGVSTYEDTILTQEMEDSDREDELVLPGSKKIDVSQIRRKLEAEVHKILVISSKEMVICTSFGVILLSNYHKAQTFNPYELSPNLTPKLVGQLLLRGEYSSAVTVALKLNLPSKQLSLNDLLKKIPTSSIKATISELDQQKIQLLLEKICERPLQYRETLWVQIALQKGVQIVPVALRAALELMDQQVRVMDLNRGVLEMVHQLANN